MPLIDINLLYIVADGVGFGVFVRFSFLSATSLVFMASHVHIMANYQSIYFHCLTMKNDAEMIG